MNVEELTRRLVACSLALLAARSPTARDARYREWEAVAIALRDALNRM